MIEANIHQVCLTMSRDSAGEQLKLHLPAERKFVRIPNKAHELAQGFESHSTISGWLKKGDNATGMNPATELAVRMIMAHHIDSFKVVNENTPSILSEIEESRSTVDVAA